MGTDEAEAWSNEPEVRSDEARAKSRADKTSIEATLKASSSETTTPPCATLSCGRGCSQH